MVFAGTRDTGGATALNHFVLGTNDPVLPGAGHPDRATVYDPWPQDGGTSFVRGAPGVGERPIGGDLARSSAPFAGATGATPGVDLDFFSPID